MNTQRKRVFSETHGVPEAVAVGVLDETPQSVLRVIQALRFPRAVQLVSSGAQLLVHVVVLVARQFFVVPSDFNEGLLEHDGIVDRVGEPFRLRPKRFSGGAEGMAQHPGGQPGL